MVDVLCGSCKRILLEKKRCFIYATSFCYWQPCKWSGTGGHTNKQGMCFTACHTPLILFWWRHIKGRSHVRNLYSANKIKGTISLWEVSWLLKLRIIFLQFHSTVFRQWQPSFGAEKGETVYQKQIKESHATACCFCYFGWSSLCANEIMTDSFIWNGHCWSPCQKLDCFFI